MLKNMSNTSLSTFIEKILGIFNMDKKKFIKEFTKGIKKLNKKDVDLEFLTKLKYENLPKSLYKYCSFDKKNLNLDNLKNDMVWMTKPSTFNDPYEFTYSINLEKVLEYNYSDKINIFAEVNIRNFSADELNKMVKDIRTYDVIIENLLSEKKITKEEVEDFERRYLGVIEQSINNEDIKKNFKVSCFAEECNLLLMWSHYAENHTGFCIEYDIDSLLIDSPITKSLYPIIYTNELFDTTEYFLHKAEGIPNIDYLLEGMITKSLDWEYEKEWRLVIRDDDPIGAKFDMPKPKSIYLGSEFDVNNLEHFYSFCSDNGIELYQMKRSKSKYELIPEKIL